jgi:hypothetical protein
MIPIGRVFDLTAISSGPMFSKREILVFVAGSFLAIVLTVLGTLYVFKYYLVLHDPSDPLVKQGGLKPSQEVKR